MKQFFFQVFLLLFSSTFVFSQEYKEGIGNKGNKPFVLHQKPISPNSEIESLDIAAKSKLELNKVNSQNLNLNFDNPSSTSPSFIHQPYAKFIIPTTLIAYGLTTRFYKPLRNLDRSTDHEIGEHYPRTVWVDDYLQFAPALSVYGLDLFGVKAKHNFRDRTLIVATSYLVMGGTVEAMKRTISVSRPGDRGTSSFPSGHTATAFVGAHILMKEYNDVSPFIGLAGYTAATGVGVMRMINRKHWISDVVTGAGIGILSAEVGYLMLPVWHNILGINGKEESLVFMPTAMTDCRGGMGYGVGMSYSF